MSDNKFPPCPVNLCRNKLGSPKQLMCSSHWDSVSESTKALIQAQKKDRTSEAFKLSVSKAISEVVEAEQEEKELFDYLGRLGR